MTRGDSLPADYFERLYAADADPWQFATSAYEDAKYSRSLAVLPAGRFARALEIGCSIGVLTRRLAGRCARLVAVDVSEAALAQARYRCANERHVEFRRMQIPQSYPDGCFDLVVVSEVGYYWSRDDLARAATKIIESLGLGGSLLLVHWTEPVAEYPLDGDAVHEHFMARAAPAGALQHRHGERHPQYRLDLFARIGRHATSPGTGDDVACVN